MYLCKNDSRKSFIKLFWTANDTLSFSVHNIPSHLYNLILGWRECYYFDYEISVSFASFLLCYLCLHFGCVAILKNLFSHDPLEPMNLRRLPTFCNLHLYCKDSNPNSWFSFSVLVPGIAPVIANAALHWTDSSFWWNHSLSTLS